SEAARTFKPEDCPQPPPSTAAGLNPAQREPLPGEPPMPHDPPPAGTVQLKAAAARDVVIDGVTFHAPAAIRLPPGRHEAHLKDGKKTVKRAFDVKLDGTLVLDLDHLN